MFMVMEDPLALDDPQPAPREKRYAPSPPRFTERPPRFAVSEGAGQHVGFWLVVFGIMAFLAVVALIGFGPR